MFANGTKHSRFLGGGVVINAKDICVMTLEREEVSAY